MILNWLLEPAISLNEPQRRRARLLSALLLTLFLLGSLATILTIFSTNNLSGLYVSIISTIMMAAGYYLSRTHYYSLAAALTVGTLSVSVFVVQVLNPGTNYLHFLILGVLVSSLFLSRQATVLVLMITTVSMALLLISTPSIQLEGLVSALFAVICVGILGIVAITIRQQDLEQIEKQTSLLNKDLHEHKQTEVVLLASEERFRALVEHSLEEVSLVSADGTLLYESPSVRRPLGYPPDSFVGHNLLELFHPDDQEAALHILQQVAGQPGSTQEAVFRLRHQDGSWRWMEGILTNLLDEPAIRAVVINYRDVTERRLTEEARRQSEILFQALFELSPDAIVLIDPHDTHVPWKVINCNAAACIMNGYDPDELIGSSIEILNTNPATPPERKIYLEQVRQAGNHKFESQHRRKNGEVFPVEVTTRLITVDGRELVIGIDRDITQRKRAEEQLQQHTAQLAASEERLRAILDNTSAIVYMLDVQGRHIFVNRTWEKLVGISRDQAAGKTVYDVWPTEFADIFDAANQVVLQNEKAVEQEEMAPEADGLHHYLALKFPLFDASGVLYAMCSISTDITERKRAEVEIKERLAELEGLNQIATTLRVTQTLDELLSFWLDATLSILNTTQGSVWLYDNFKDELYAAVIRGYDGKEASQPVKPGQGIAGSVFASRQPYISNNAHPDLHSSEVLQQYGPPGTGIAAVPIQAANNVIGTLIVNVSPPRDITLGEVRFLTTLCEMAGNAIHRTRLHEQTERRLQHLTALTEIDRAITSGFDLRLSLTTLLVHAIAQLGIDAADILLFDSSSLMLEYAATCGFRGKGIEHMQPRLDSSYAGQAILARQVVKVLKLEDQRNDEYLVRPWVEEGFVSYYAVPLTAKGQVVGVMEVFKRTPLEPDTEWLDFFNTLAGQAAIAIDNVKLFENLQRSNAELALAYDSTIEGWSHALDLRDKETEGHTKRVTAMTIKLARAFGFTEDELIQLRWGALLHDIGKMGIPDGILLKPGPLTDKEWVLMKKHPTFAYEMLSPIRYLRAALDIPYCHHEKWDGTGYPRGLKDQQIPLSARIFAVVDVWDALISNRPYRKAWPKKKVIEHILSLSGSHFDPQVVEVFMQVVNES